MSETDSEMLTVREVADKLKLSAQCVYALIESGRLLAHRFGVGRGTIRVSRPDLDLFVQNSRRVKKLPQLESQAKPRFSKLKHIKLDTD